MIKKILNLLAFFLLGFQTPVNALVGKTAANFSVSQGAATYSIPIIVPPGINGLTPQLSLNYNSKEDIGQLGVGWKIQGLTAITRCGKSLATHGEVRHIQLDSKDRFCLNGQPLILVSGTYGANHSEYRTEIDSYQKITAFGQKGNGPSYFKVHNKSGEIIEFGNSGGSKIEAQDKTIVHSWVINKISDRFGNAITYHYNERNQYSESVPTRISYSLGGNIQAHIEFSYANLSSRLISDGAINKIQGSRVAQSRYLGSIKVKIDNAIIRSYTPTYEHRHRHKTPLYPLVKSIQECVQEQCFPAIQFEWDKQKALAKSTNPSVKPQHLLNNPSNLNQKTNNITLSPWHRGPITFSETLTKPDNQLTFINKSCSTADPDSRTCTSNSISTGLYLGSHRVDIWQTKKRDDKRQTTLTDLNNDGLTDVVVNGVGFFLNQGNSKMKNVGNTYYIDYNGDGAEDKLSTYYSVKVRETRENIYYTTKQEFTISPYNKKKRPNYHLQ